MSPVPSLVQTTETRTSSLSDVSQILGSTWKYREGKEKAETPPHRPTMLALGSGSFSCLQKQWCPLLQWVGCDIWLRASYLDVVVQLSLWSMLMTLTHTCRAEEIRGRPGENRIWTQQKNIYIQWIAVTPQSPSVFLLACHTASKNPSYSAGFCPLGQGSKGTQHRILILLRCSSVDCTFQTYSIKAPPGSQPNLPLLCSLTGTRISTEAHLPRAAIFDLLIYFEYIVPLAHPTLPSKDTRPLHFSDYFIFCILLPQVLGWGLDNRLDPNWLTKASHLLDMAFREIDSLKCQCCVTFSSGFQACLAWKSTLISGLTDPFSRNSGTEYPSQLLWRQTFPWPCAWYHV